MPFLWGGHLVVPSPVLNKAMHIFTMSALRRCLSCVFSPLLSLPFTILAKQGPQFDYQKALVYSELHVVISPLI